ncbi:MAG: cell division protein ZapA [Velocimicrobium sp.]
MRTKNDIEVIINNRKYTLSGYESDGYLQSVATYINGKYEEFKMMNAFNKLELDMRNVLIQLNIADDYFKARSKAEELDKKIEKKKEEMFEMKHELISMQSRLDAVQKELQTLKFENIEEQKKVVKLETELDERRKKK